MADAFTTPPNFNFGDSFGDDDSGIGMKSGTNSIKLDSEAHSVRSWESESERSWQNESDDEDDNDLGALDAWMNDEEYIPDKKDHKQARRPSQIDTNDRWQMTGQISGTLSEEFKNIMKVESARERARKATRELIKERNDTSGGGTRSLKREHIIIKWMLRITHLNKDMSIDFADWIQDGTVLTIVLTTLDFNSVEKDKYKQKGDNPAKDRIEKVQKAILNYGVEPKYLFKVDDVLYRRNTPKVIRTLEEVAKISRQETHIVLDTLRKDKLFT